MDEPLFFAFITAAFMLLPTICGIIAGLFKSAKKVCLILGCLFSLLPWALWVYIESQAEDQTLDDFFFAFLFFTLMFAAGGCALFFSYHLKKNLLKSLSGLILTFSLTFGILNLWEYVLDQFHTPAPCVIEPSKEPAKTDSLESR